MSKMKLLCVHSWESCTTSLDCCLAITLVLHKHTHMLFHSYALPSLKSCFCFLESERFGSAHTDYPYTTCTVSHFFYHLHCARCRYFTSILLSDVKTVFVSKKHFPQLHTERNWTVCRIPSKQKSIWQLSHGDNEPMNLKSSIRVENGSCTRYLQVLASEIL